MYECPQLFCSVFLRIFSQTVLFARIFFSSLYLTLIINNFICGCKTTCYLYFNFNFLFLFLQLTQVLKLGLMNDKLELVEIAEWVLVGETGGVSVEAMELVIEMQLLFVWISAFVFVLFVFTDKLTLFKFIPRRLLPLPP